MSTLSIRDFIYLDIERVRSIVAQMSGGFAQERTLQHSHDTGSQGTVKAGLPLVAEASGQLDYHYLRSHSETRSLHDYIFEEFFKGLNSNKKLIHIPNSEDFTWVESDFRDGTLIYTTGLLKIVDYQELIVRLLGVPSVLNLLEKLDTSTPKPESTKGHPSVKSIHENQWQLVRRQYGQIPVKEIANLVKEFYGDLIKLKIFPCYKDLNRVLVGTADKSAFRYSPTILTNLYGSVIDANWSFVLQINKGKAHEVGQVKSNTGNALEDGIEQIVDGFSSINVLAQGIKFPAIAVVPIAIFRTV